MDEGGEGGGRGGGVEVIPVSVALEADAILLW